MPLEVGDEPASLESAAEVALTGSLAAVVSELKVVTSTPSEELAVDVCTSDVVVATGSSVVVLSGRPSVTLVL